MSFQRRNFLKAGVVISMLTVVSRSARAHRAFAPQRGPWRRFELRTRIEIGRPEGATQAWGPVPQAETASRQLDCLEPDQFSYVITAKELAA